MDATKEGVDEAMANLDLMLDKLPLFALQQTEANVDVVRLFLKKARKKLPYQATIDKTRKQPTE